MRPFNELNKAVLAIARVLMDLYYALEDYPVVGDVLQVPVLAVWGHVNDISLWLNQIDEWQTGLFDHLWEEFRELAPWLADPVGRLWTGIWERISGAHTWMLDPAGNLWVGIWERIRQHYTWITNPIAYLWDGIWDRIRGGDPWLYDPVHHLWTGIWTKITGVHPWLKDPTPFIWNVFALRFFDFFWTFLELHATIVIEVAGRILESSAIWHGPDYPEEEED